MLSYPEDGNDFYHQLEDDSFWFQHRNECLLAAFDRLPPDGTLYDVGGGNGFVTFALQEAGYPAALVEPGPAGAANARAMGVREVIQGTLEESGVGAAGLPAIGIFDVLEHQADDDGFLAMLHRHLTPGGRLYVTVPAYSALWSVEDDLAGHHRRYRGDQLSAVIARSGFEIEYWTYLFWFLPAPIWLLRSVPSRLGLRKHRTMGVAQREHSASGGLSSRLVDALLGWETRAVRAGRRVPFGGSLFCVARARARS